MNQRRDLLSLQLLIVFQEGMVCFVSGCRKRFSDPPHKIPRILTDQRVDFSIFFNLLHRIFVYQSMILIVVRYSFVSCLKWIPKFLLYILHFLKGTDAVMGDDKVAEQT